MKKCIIEGCEKEVLAKGYCSKHYTQMRRHNKILKRTRKDENVYLIYENYAEIIFYDNKNNEKARVKISLEDIERCKEIRWVLNGNNYVQSSKTKVLLHRFILNCPENQEVDHIDRDILNNTRDNLRIVTSSNNKMNQDIRCDNTSGVRGVSWDKASNRWVAYINLKGKRVEREYFLTKEEAIKSRKKWEEKYFKEFVPK